MFLCFLGDFCFLGPHLRHVEVPRRGAELELQLPASATATAAPDPNPLSKAWERSATARFLVGFVAAAPRWELLPKCF